MEKLLGKSIYRSALTKLAVLGALAFCGTASPLFAQGMVSGKFTLHENARLRENVLPAGSYAFSIEPTGVSQSIGSLPAVGTPVVVTICPEKGAGPVAKVFAMALRTRATDASHLVLMPGKEGATVQSMYLEEQQLLLDFDWAGSKAKGQMIAQARNPQTVPMAK